MSQNHWTYRAWPANTSETVVPGVNGWVECPACDGRGSLQRGGDNPPDCHKCDGLGLVKEQ